MKTGNNFGLLYCLMLVCQIIICSFSPLGPYVTLSLLPAMILCMPLSINTIGCMLIAFGSGLAVDWLSEGLIGINAASLVPVALARNYILKLFFGKDLITRGDSFSIKKYGTAKVSAALMSALTIYLAIYIMLDGAGTRETWFNFAIFGGSLISNWLLSLLVAHLLTPDDRR